MQQPTLSNKLFTSFESFNTKYEYDFDKNLLGKGNWGQVFEIKEKNS